MRFQLEPQPPELKVNNQRDIESRTESTPDLRGHAAAMLVLLACALAQIGYLVLVVQKNIRPTPGIAIVTSYGAAHRDPSLAQTPRMQSAGYELRSRAPPSDKAQHAAVRDSRR